jgi:hypothetical protein
MSFKLHITGVLVHGINPHVFIDKDTTKQGHTVTIQVLFELIAYEKKKRDGKLPKNLCLQLDNTTNQNKDKYLMAFTELLVNAGGTFETIKINFLEVGHTHKDIDQMFTRFVACLRLFDVITHFHLVRQLCRGYRTKEGYRPTVWQRDTVTDISGWFDKQGLQTVPEVTKYRSFKFSRTIVDEPRIQVITGMSESPGDEYRYPKTAKTGHR